MTEHPDALDKALESSYDKAKQHALTEQKHAFEMATIALTQAFLTDSRTAVEARHLAETTLRWISHFITATLAAGEMSL